METRKNLRPKMKFGINYFIQEQCDVHNLTNALLFEKLNIAKEKYHNIVESKEKITKEFAEKLAKLFSTSTQYWINIDKNYNDWLTNRDK